MTDGSPKLFKCIILHNLNIVKQEYLASHEIISTSNPLNRRYQWQEKKREKVCTAYQVNFGHFYGICEKNENLTLNCNCLSMSVGLDFNHHFPLIAVQMLSLLFIVWEGN